MSLQTPDTIGRAELLIVPLHVPAALDQDALVRSLGKTLDAPRCLTATCGAFRIMVLTGDGLAETDRPRPLFHRLDIAEGLWPEPLGFRLTALSSPRESTWWVESDRYGVRPIWWGLDKHRRPIVSTRPDIVAALIGSRLSARTLVELLLVGFPLDSHCLFDRVRRLRPGQRLAHTRELGFSVNDADPEQTHAVQGEPETWIRTLGPEIAEAFARGAALELSGGVDSRLVLGLGLHEGARPRLAFTLGSHEDEDVQVAQRICRRFGIEHHVLPTEAGDGRLVGDGRRLVERSGFAVNACSYAWLPGAFGRLAPRRDEQIGGGGGECAAGFYYSPFDAFCALPVVPRVWVRKRLFTSGIDAGRLFGPDRGRRFAAEAAETVLRHLSTMAGSWRRRTDELYLTQRVPNAGGPVLSASACWYLPRQPLLHSPYIEWGRRLNTAQRAGRRAQMNVIHQLVPELGTLPYAGHTRTAHGSAATLQAVRRLHRLERKIRRRLSNTRAEPDLGAASVSAVLVGDESVRHSLRCLAKRDDLELNPRHLERMINEPCAFTHELGALMTAAWAAEAAEAVAEDLRAASAASARGYRIAA